MTRKYNIHYTDLVCLNCGNINTIQRMTNKRRSIGHIKDLYCHICKIITKHYEIQDIDLFKLKYQEYENEILTSETNPILSIIEGIEENAKKRTRVFAKIPPQK